MKFAKVQRELNAMKKSILTHQKKVEQFLAENPKEQAVNQDINNELKIVRIVQTVYLSWILTMHLTNAFPLGQSLNLPKSFT